MKGLAKLLAGLLLLSMTATGFLELIRLTIVRAAQVSGFAR